MAWDVTVPDTYAESHIANTLSTPGAAAEQAAQQKISEYASLASTHIFRPIAIETAGHGMPRLSSWYRRLGDASLSSPGP